VRWSELHDETGSVSPRRRGLTLQELEQRLHAGLVLVTTERSIRRFFERHGISFKKTLRAAEQDRPTSPKPRLKWKAEQSSLDARKPTTFVAGLRCNEISAPCVLDGPVAG